MTGVSSISNKKGVVFTISGNILKLRASSPKLADPLLKPNMEAILASPPVLSNPDSGESETFTSYSFGRLKPMTKPIRAPIPIAL